MSWACPSAAFASRRLDLSGRRPRDVRSWLTRHSAAFAITTVDIWVAGPSPEAQTVAAEAGEAAAATATRRRRGNAIRCQVRMYPTYRVKTYPPKYPLDVCSRVWTTYSA